MQNQSGPAWAVLALTVLVILMMRRLGRRSIRDIRGPPSPSFLLGHELLLADQQEVGDFEFQWMREYGPTWRTRAVLGENFLVTADPKAIQHIFQKAGHNFTLKKERTQIGRIFSPGVASATGERHRRHRKVMGPAFSPSHVRTFLPLFQRLGRKFCDCVREDLGNGARTLSWNHYLSRVTLDIIGQATFDYDFGALDNTETPLTKSYKKLMASIGVKLTAGAVLFRATWGYFPFWLLDLMRHIPRPPFTVLREVGVEFEKIGHELIERNAGDDAPEGKDIVSVLMKANKSEDPRTRLDDTEVMAQMHTLTAAGHETTSSVLGWISRELALHPEYQAALRAEVRSALAERDGELTLEDLDKLRLVGNAIKETLRMHPIVYGIERIAVADDVLPLDYPITTASGKVITEIPISAGQTVRASVSAYQRLPQVWGEDAHVWNPSRFDKIDPTEQTRVGFLSNLMVYSAGHKGCVGWFFATLELQALLVELVNAFEFRLPADKTERVVLRSPGTGLMQPYVRGREHEGARLPLEISVAP